MDSEEIEIKELMALIWKKRSIIVILSIISIICGVIFTFVKPKQYSSTALIMFGRIDGYEPREGESQLLSEIQFNNSIMNSYKNYVYSNDVLETVIKNLNIDTNIGELKKNIEVEVESATLKVHVTDSDMGTSIKIANEIVNVFAEKSREFYDINHHYSISQADESSIESSNSYVSDITIAFFIGLFISIAWIIITYLFNNKVYNENDIEVKLKLPLISKLNYIEGIDNNISQNFEVSEQFKVLRANVEFSTKNMKNNKSFFMTSINPNDGKSFVSTNLALSFAEIGKKVLIIDADKKAGKIDKIFDVKNDFGLSNYLVDSRKMPDTAKSDKLIVSTSYDNLDVITIGNVKGNKFKIIQNNKFVKLFRELEERYDVIIVDGTEMLKYADSRFLSNLCNQTIVIASVNKTKSDDLVKAKKEIEKVKGNLLGIILNYV